MAHDIRTARQLAVDHYGLRLTEYEREVKRSRGIDLGLYEFELDILKL